MASMCDSRQCDICQNVFSPTRINQVTCSDACRRIKRRRYERVKQARREERLKSTPEGRDLLKQKRRRKYLKYKNNISPEARERRRKRKAKYNSKPEVKERRNARRRERMKTDPEFRRKRYEYEKRRRRKLRKSKKTAPAYILHRNLQKQLRSHLQTRSFSITSEFAKILGCSPAQFYSYLMNHPKRKSWMTQATYGPADKTKKTWQLGHDIPVSQFIREADILYPDNREKREQHIKLAFHHSNLFPQCAMENSYWGNGKTLTGQPQLPLDFRE